MSGDTSTSTPPVIPDYTLLRAIGRGSYGEVWLARSVTGVFRVVKIVHRNRFEDERPFLRELQGISRFQAAVSGRPRQLALLHVGLNEAEGYFYYVMEPADDAVTGSAIDPEKYVPLTLRELYRRRGRLPAQECVQLALELARGLAVLHGAGLIHRDIKPSNIIFVQGVPKLADVGLVAATESTLSCVGTPGYVPPEGPGSATADIYSLGKVLYEIATGLDRHRFPEIPSDYQDDSDFPLLGEINTVVVRACEPTADKRHPTVEAFARDLELIQAGKSLAFYESVRRRLRVFAYVAGTIAILAGLAATLLYWQFDVRARANEQTRRALYRSDLAVAQLAKASGDLGRARAALQRQIPRPGETDLRSLEWSILAREVQGEGQPLQPIPSGAAVSKLVADRTGRWLAGAIPGDQVVLWDLRTGRISRTIEHAAVLGGFSPEGDLVIDEPERALRYENLANSTHRRVETGQRLLELADDGRPFVISPSGDAVITCYSKVAPYSSRTFNVSREWPGFDVINVAPSLDGKSFLISVIKEDGALQERILANINLGNSSVEWERKVSDRLVWIRSCPDTSQVLINLGGLTPTYHLLASGKTAGQFIGHTARVEDAAFAPSGDLLATVSADETVRVWSAKTTQQLETLRGLVRPGTAITWLADGRHIAASDDAGRVAVFSYPTNRKSPSLSGLYSDIHGDVVFDNSGSEIAASQTTESIALIDKENLTIKRTITNAFQPITYKTNNESLFAFRSDWSIAEINLISGLTTGVANFFPKGHPLLSWAISPNKRIVTASFEKAGIFAINLTSGTPFKPSADLTNSSIWAVCFSRDSSSIITGSQQGQIMRWNLATGEYSEFSRIQGDIQTLALSPDERWLAASTFNDSSLRVYRSSERVWTHPLARVHRRFVTSLIFSNDGKRLISSGADGKVVFWSIPEFQEIAAFEATQPDRPAGDEGISLLRLSPINDALAGLTEDGRLYLWRAQ